MKKILFITLDTAVGGVSASLSCLYEQIKNQYNITVLTLTSLSGAEINFQQVLKPSNVFINAYYSNFRNSPLSKKPLILLIKVLGKICKKLDVDFGAYIAKKTMRNEESKNIYDTVVGFGEGAAALVASFSNCQNKIAWIHCDYGMQSFDDEYCVFKMFTKIVNVSKTTSSHFVEMYPSLSDKCTYIYNLTNEKLIRALSNMSVSDFEFRNGVFHIISIGRIDSVKRYSEIPRIAASIKEKGLKFQWIIVGPIRDENEFVKLENGIRQYAVGDIVKWIGGKKNPYPYLKCADLLVSLSSSEACPMVFNEARVLNVPIVSTDFQSAFEFISTGVDGLIAPLETIDESIILMMSDKDLYRRIMEKSVCSLINNNEIVRKINQIL